MVTPHRVHYDLFVADRLLPDPGDAGTIRTSRDMEICEMVSAAGETRTLEVPTKPGIRLTLRLKTYVGDIVVYAAEGFNVALETYATFNAASDIMELISVTTSTGYRWQILEGNIGSVSLV